MDGFESRGKADLIDFPLWLSVSHIGRMIAKCRADLISGLVHAEENGQPLREQELHSMIALLIVAGHETTVTHGQWDGGCTATP